MKLDEILKFLQHIGSGFFNYTVCQTYQVFWGGFFFFLILNFYMQRASIVSA